MWSTSVRCERLLEDLHTGVNVGVRPAVVPPAELIFVLVFPLADYCWENGPAECRNIACATAES